MYHHILLFITLYNPSQITIPTSPNSHIPLFHNSSSKSLNHLIFIYYLPFILLFLPYHSNLDCNKLYDLQYQIMLDIFYCIIYIILSHSFILLLPSHNHFFLFFHIQYIISTNIIHYSLIHNLLI